MQARATKQGYLSRLKNKRIKKMMTQNLICSKHGEMIKELIAPPCGGEGFKSSTLQPIQIRLT
jgi:hypothetical protein